MTAHKWNAPKKPKPLNRETYVPVPPEGMARCIQQNDYGFVVGKEYRFQTRSEVLARPPYDVVTVQKDDFSEDSPWSCWVFMNSHNDLFRKAFEIV